MRYFSIQQTPKHMGNSRKMFGVTPQITRHDPSIFKTIAKYRRCTAAVRADKGMGNKYSTYCLLVSMKNSLELVVLQDKARYDHQMTVDSVRVYLGNMTASETRRKK